MPKFLLRCTRDFELEVEAQSLDEAKEILENSDVHEWEYTSIYEVMDGDGSSLEDWN